VFQPYFALYSRFRQTIASRRSRPSVADGRALISSKLLMRRVFAALKVVAGDQPQERKGAAS
jgi:hypothetical protein